MQTEQKPFAFPPLYSFPPFFTLQSNTATLATQLTQWTQLVLAWCRHTRTFYLDVDDAQRLSLWGNDALQRRLPRDARARVFQYLVKEQHKAAWDTPGLVAPKSANLLPSNRILVFWRRPDEWGDLIYSWVVETGQQRSIMTFFELTEGDLVQDQDFRNLPIPLLRLSLQTLVQKGKAQFLQGTEAKGGAGDDGDLSSGVKFA